MSIDFFFLEVELSLKMIPVVRGMVAPIKMKIDVIHPKS